MWPTEDAWRSTVPTLTARAAERWDLRIGESYSGGSASHVVSVRNTAGEDAVLKLSLPHAEAQDEGAALRWWNGSGAVRLLASDPDDPFVLLLERCTPGTRLTDRHDLSAAARLTIAAELLTGLWDSGIPDESPFTGLADIAGEWATLTEMRMSTLAPPLDPGIVRSGCTLLRDLPRSAERTVVVHGDYNPGNVLTATRRPWLVIDPKPMVGDPAYDLCPLIMQIDDPFTLSDSARHVQNRIALLSDLTGQKRSRILAWSVARSVEWALWHASRSAMDRAQDSITRATLLSDLLQR